jgi:dipeptidyl aminopeptidase/acylaminoacyl peptidase
MQDDVTDGVAWLVSEGVADPKRVCIVGGSYGGYVALVAAYKTPDLYRCAASFAGVSDLSRMLKYDRRMMAPKRYRSWRDRMTGDEERAIEENSPLRHVDRISMPILLVHGTEDRRVPVSQSDWMTQALRDAGKPVESLRIDGAGHSFEQDDHLAALLRAVEGFVMRHNPADALPGGPALN